MTPLTPGQVLARGLDQRTLDYWIERGLLHPVGRGHGTPRHWPTGELEVADTMRRLVDAGFTADGAAKAARAHQEGRPLVLVGPGLVLAIDTDLLSEVTL